MAVIDVTVSIEIPPDSLSNGVVLYQREAGDEAWKRLGVFDEGDTTIEGMTIGTEYEVGAALIDADGNPTAERDWDIQTIRPLGNQDLPPTVTDFGVSQDEEFLEAGWKDVSVRMRDFAYYEIRVGASWAQGLLVAKLTTNAHRWNWSTSGSLTVRLSAFDAYGRRSAETTYTIDVTALEGFVDGTATDDHGGGYAGTKTDVEVDTGNLVMSTWGDPIDAATDTNDNATWLCDGKYEGTFESAEIDLGSVRTVRIENDMVATSTLWDPVIDDALYPICHPQINPNDGTPFDLTDESTIVTYGDRIIDGDEAPLEVLVEIKYDETTAIAQSYQPFIPGFYKCRYYRMRIRFRAWDRRRIPKLTKLTHKERKQNLKDEGNLLVITTPGPTPITFAANFIDAPTVCANVEGSTGLVVRPSNITISGCNLRTYDDAGSETFDTADRIHWMAMGT